MNIKKKKLIGILGSLGLLLGIVATIIPSVISNNITNNQANNNIAIQNDNNQESINNFANQKAAVPGDFLLNSENAIELTNNITNNNAYSVVSGPRGFASLQNNKITYTGFDGELLWTSLIDISSTEHSLIAIDYNNYSNSFVALINRKSNLEIVSIKEDSAGTPSSSSQTITGNAAFSTDLSRVILSPVIISGNMSQYFIIPQYQGNGVNVYTGYFVNINQDGILQAPQQCNLPTNINSGYDNRNMIVSLGTYSFFNPDLFSEQYIVCLMFNFTKQEFYIQLYKIVPNNFSVISISISINNIFKIPNNNVITDYKILCDENVKQISSYQTQGILGSRIDTNILYCILNYDKNNNVIFAVTNNNSIEEDPPSAPRIDSSIGISRTFYLNDNDWATDPINFSIHSARTYGEYLYAFIKYYNIQSGIYESKIMRLKLGITIPQKSQWVWNNDFNNEYINLWDLPFSEQDNKQIIALPILNNNTLASDLNVMTFINNQKNYWLLDGNDNALAYDTTSKTGDSFKIDGVDDVTVANADLDLTTYFDNAMFTNNFTQYQKGSTYTLTKKTTDSDIIENAKGRIPATLTIKNAYNNQSLTTTPKEIGIVLTGFKDDSSTSISSTNQSIGLDVFPYQIPLVPNDNINPDWNNTTNKAIRDFISNNIIQGAHIPNTTPINSSDITKIQLDANPFDNKNGKLIIKSITLNRYFENAVEHTGEKQFFLPNNANLEIVGFKTIAGPTEKNNAPIAVSGALASMNALDASAQKPELITWLNDNKAAVFNNLPEESMISDVTIVSTTSTQGEMLINVEVDKYFDNNPFYTYVDTKNSYSDITLNGFIPKDWSTTTKSPQNNVSGSLVDLLPNQIDSNNLVFKQYIFDNIIVDESQHDINANDIINFTGTPDNIAGIYTLTSITLKRVVDPNGNIVNAETTLDGFQYEIRGFKSSSLETTINPNPTQPLPEALKNILAQKVTLAVPEFKTYIFNYVLIDRTNPKLLSEANIDSISVFTYNNLTGTIQFKLTLDNSVDINGALTNTTKTFDETITISGFKQVLPTNLISNPTISNSGDANVWADDVTEANYTKIVKDNFNSILTNLPDGFSEANITSITKASVDNNTGTLYVNISLDLYYNQNNGSESTAPELPLDNIAIDGWKSYPFIILNNRVDASLYQSNYATQFAGSAINSVAGINLLLQDQKFLDIVCPDQQGLAMTAFTASVINRTDNLKGEIEFSMDVAGGQFHPNQNIVTLYGFRPTITIGSWINQISNIKGIGTVAADIENDVLEQVWNAANTLPSPFGRPILKNEITVSLQSLGSITVNINTSNFIDNSANIVTTPTDIKFNVNYEITAPKNFENNDWIYIVIFSITGVAGFVVLLWLIYVIIKKTQDKWFK